MYDSKASRADARAYMFADLVENLKCNEKTFWSVCFESYL